MRAVRLAMVVATLGCGGSTPAQRSCEAYAATFAEVAANDCNRGSLEDNLAAFKEAARVGSDCELVASIRDQALLEATCLPWFRAEVPKNCALLDDGNTFLLELPEACRGQLQLQ